MRSVDPAASQDWDLDRVRRILPVLAAALGGASAEVAGG
jgi:hypothetical protein